MSSQQDEITLPESIKISLAEVRDRWKRSPSGESKPHGDWLDEIDYYFSLGIRQSELRLDIIAHTAKSCTPEVATKCAQECSSLKEELNVCGAVATLLFELVRQMPSASKTAE